MGLLGDLIGGAFGLAADVTGAVINAGVEAHNEKKKQQQIEGNSGLLDNFMNSCIALGKDSVLETRHELYKNGLSETTDETIAALISLGGFHRFYMGIIDNEDALDKVFDYVDNLYNAMFKVHEKYAVDETMKSDFKTAEKELLVKAKEKVTELLTLKTGVITGLNRCINFTLILPLLCLLENITKDTGYHATIEVLHQYQKDFTVIFTSLHPLEHGEFELDDPKTIDINKVVNRINEVEEHIADNTTGYYEGIKNYLNSDFLFVLGLRMWYYADLTPFDQASFNIAANTLNEYKSLKGNDLERVLAEVYVKNKLGGEMLVMQNIDEIMENATVRNPLYARALCSFLAWIGCYQVELEVLKKAVQEKIQLTADMLERLEFLAKGGAINKIKIYEANVSDDVFYFDSSTENMDSSGIDALFDALQRKRRVLNYSLTMKKWTKTIPLPKEKVFSPEALDISFKELIEDFDNEIEYRIGNASAVDLTNLSYPNCALFHFTSERNRGITMLFDCEKFGRNLNLTILTLFTPDSSMNTDMVRYAKAVSNNRYAESFQESILQALDASLKEKADIYGTSTETGTNSIFE